MGRQIYPSPVFVLFVVIMAFTGMTAGLATPGGGGAHSAADVNSISDGEDTVVASYESGSTCENCHDTLPTNTTKRTLQNEVANQPDHEFELNHGEDMWCLDCHATENRNELRMPNGSTVAWTEQNETQLCAACHGPVYEDFTNHIHGKWTGSWQNATAEKQCTDCHDPHDPEFQKIEPDQPPEPPASGPEVAQSVLSPIYYAGIGAIGVVALGLLGYATWGIKND